MRPFGDSLCKYETNHSRSSGLSFTLDVRRVWSDLLLIPHDAQSHQGMRRDESGVSSRSRQEASARKRFQRKVYSERCWVCPKETNFERSLSF